MKMIRYNYLLLFLVATVFFTNCGDDKKGDDAGVPGKGKMTINIDGTKETFSNAMYIVSSGNHMITASNVSANAKFASMTLMIYPYGGATITTGDYPIDLFYTNGIYATVVVLKNLSGQSSYVATGGTITISKLTDSNIQGSFTGTAVFSDYDSNDETKWVSMSGGFNADALNF